MATTAGESPHLGPARSKWERRYATKLLITDTVVVCGAVMLAQYVRFGTCCHATQLCEPLRDGLLGSARQLSGYLLWSYFVVDPQGTSASASRSIGG